MTRSKDRGAPAVPATGQPRLIGLTPEAQAALGGPCLQISKLPFRVGRESRREQRLAARAITDRRKPGRAPNNDLYLAETVERLNVSREHFQIDHNGSQYILLDRQSTCGTIVEGTVVGGRNTGGAAPLRDGDVIIVGTSGSCFVFKFRAG